MRSASFQEVLILLKKSMDPSELDEIIVSDWDILFRELKSQAVLAMPTDILEKIIPDEKQTYLVGTVAWHYRTLNRHLFVQNELVRLFTEHHISFVILKGLAIARYYPIPEYRSLGDIDIAVLHDEYAAAKKIMLDNGYCEMENPYEKHDVLTKDGVIFELHKYFVSTNDIEKADYIEEIIQGGIRSPQICTFHGYQFPVLPPAANGIMLLEHMSQHLESGLGLRHLLDWMVFVSGELDDNVWNTVFKEMADASGLRFLAEISTKVCKKYLGLKGISWCDNADDEICDQLLEHIEQRGNFGCKEGTVSEKAQKLISVNKGKLYYWYRYLQRTGMKMPFFQKHKFFRPFAWIPRGCVVLLRFVKNPNTFRDLKQNIAKAQEKDKFLDKLGIRRVSGGHTFWNGKSFIIKK